MSKYRTEPEFRGWTLDELQVAITTLEHDLRGSWADNYHGRITQLCNLYDAMINAFERADKQTFITRIQKGYDYSDMANYDMIVASQEMEDSNNDGRVFRDCATFYDVPLDEKGRTQRVRDWLDLNVACDEYHWFEQDEA